MSAGGSFADRLARERELAEEKALADAEAAAIEGAAQATERERIAAELQMARDRAKALLPELSEAIALLRRTGFPTPAETAEDLACEHDRLKNCDHASLSSLKSGVSIIKTKSYPVSHVYVFEGIQRWTGQPGGRFIAWETSQRPFASIPLKGSVTITAKGVSLSPEAAAEAGVLDWEDEYANDYSRASSHYKTETAKVFETVLDDVARYLARKAMT